MHEDTKLIFINFTYNLIQKFQYKKMENEKDQINNLSNIIIYRITLDSEIGMILPCR